MSLPKLWDEYEVKARYIPCFISVVPLVHFLIQLLGSSFWETIAGNIGWMLVTNLSFSLIFMLALIQLQCGIAKHWIEESVFGKGGERFPTTDMLLLNEGYLSGEFKTRIREQISKMFAVNFLSIDLEKENLVEARLIAREAVGFVRRYVGKGVMTHQYNIRYGFMRNLIGGFIWVITGSLGCIVIYGINKNWAALSFFSVIALGFLILFSLKKPILNKLAFAYADTLFNEFLNKGDKNG